MRATQFLLATQKETPSDAVVVSHQLMLRAGMIRKSASGLYAWLPLGLRVLKKVENIIREEMNRAGAMEVLMPVVQTAELWQESGRWEQFGPELTRFVDRHNNDFCLGPTHEEVITDLVRHEIKSYKQLPANFYQIQTKFRDEVRPRFGIMRSREFIMKDAYSFHADQSSLEVTYEIMHQAYNRIFERIGFDFRAVLADTGSIGGTASHEFHVLADSGEDDIVFSTTSDYAANIEMATASEPDTRPSASGKSLEKIATPKQKTIEAVCDALNVPASHTVKTLIVKGEEQPWVALVLRGDHTLNEIKASKISGVGTPLTFANEADVAAATGVKPGSIGPVDLKLPLIIDKSAWALSDFVCGANEDGQHFRNANWPEQTSNMTLADIRNVERGETSPDGQGVLEIKKGIEVGHIFQLGTKYSDAMKASVLDEQGKAKTMSMGCYGIGVSRIVAAAIEQNHDEKGIMWPQAIAPFDIALVPINMHKSDAVKAKCEQLYSTLTEAGYDVLWMDEPKARLGFMLADTELIGIPHRIVIGDKGLDKGVLEYKQRHDEAAQELNEQDLLALLQTAYA